MNDALHLIVGLGNPGREYANHRHNIGFMVLDALAAKHNLRFSKMMFKGLIADGVIAARKVLLVKPMTYMNLSGTCVGPLMRYYKLLPQQLLVIYDDLDLPAGQLRLRGKGGAGGHNGMRSIIAQLGTEDFPRLRVGIGRPPGVWRPATTCCRTSPLLNALRCKRCWSAQLRRCACGLPKG